MASHSSSSSFSPFVHPFMVIVFTYLRVSFGIIPMWSHQPAILSNKQIERAVRGRRHASPTRIPGLLIRFVMKLIQEPRRENEGNGTFVLLVGRIYPVLVLVVALAIKPRRRDCRPVMLLLGLSFSSTKLTSQRSSSSTHSITRDDFKVRTDGSAIRPDKPGDLRNIVR